MDNNMLERAELALAKKKKRSVWLRIVSVLGCVVVFCTTYALILPAITMTRQTVCGLEEHAHTVQCYETRTVEGETVLSCGAEEELHTHSDSCYDSNHVPVCGYANYYVHVHNDRCYEGDTLVCDLQEIKEHTHGGNCFESEQKLICTLEEGGETHTHDDACYSQEKTLVCELEEGGEVHVHEDGCYAQEQTLTCGQEEAEGVHAHSGECYTTESKLVCEKEEKTEVHTHTDECYNTTSTLTCEKEEVTETHTHGEDCYETVETLTCRKTEVKLHTHGSSCFRTEEDGSETLVCTQVQVLEHVHSDSCFAAKTEQVVICGLEEHSHVDECYPVEETTGPTENETIPTEGEAVPTEGEAVPTEGETTPAGDENAPTEGETTPIEDEDEPTEGETMPAEDENAPTEGETMPAEDEKEPTEGETVPAETVPAEETTPAGDGTISAEVEETAPVYLSDGATQIANGTCGDNLTWTITELDDVQTLTISGSGAMNNYQYYNAPWDGYRSSIDSVIVRNGITSIGAYAFYYCNSLTSVKLPMGFVKVGAYAFSFCNLSGMLNIGLDREYYVDEQGVAYYLVEDTAYANYQPADAVLPEIITIQETGAVYTVSQIAFGEQGTAGADISWRIYDTGSECVLEISGTGEMVDNNKPWSKYSWDTDRVIIGDGITTIGDYAFSDFYGLQKIDIPDGVVSIGDDAFYYCSNLTNVDIPDSVTSIGDHAFSYCSNLTNVDIPDSVTSIGDSAFSYCSDLTSIKLPTGFVTLGSSVFSDCTQLDYPQNLPEGNYYIDDQGVMYLLTGKTAYVQYQPENTMLLDVVVDEKNHAEYTVQTAPYTIIAAGSAGAEVGWILYDTGTECVLEISGTGAMENSGWTNYQSDIDRISIGDGVTSICDSAFSSCTSLTSVTIGDGVTSIGSYAFSYCSGLARVTIPDSVTSIESYAFQECTGLTSVTIGDGVTSIGDYTFYGCRSLTEVNFPEGFVTIEANAFNGCTQLAAWLQTLTGGDYYVDEQGVIYYLLDDIAYVRYKPTDSNLPDSMTVTETGKVYAVFPYVIIAMGAASESVEWFIYDTGTECVLEISGTGAMRDYYYNQYDYSRAPWYNYTSYFDSIVIGDGITTIGGGTCRYCSSLTNVDIPDSVTSIGYSAFSGCSSLTSIDIPDSVTSIGDSAFRGCSSLTSIEIPEGVTAIPSYCFEDCSSLTSIEIPDSVTSIGSYAFSYCTSLTNVTIGDGVSSIGYEAFYGCSSLTSIEIPGNVKSIDSYAFSYCSSLTRLTIEDGVTSIGSLAFNQCSSLTSINIPDSVTSIGYSAFSGCSSLTEIDLPTGLVTLESNVFYGCTGLDEALRSLTSGEFYIDEQDVAYHLMDSNYNYAFVEYQTRGAAIPEKLFVAENGKEYIVIDGTITKSGFVGNGCWVLYNDGTKDVLLIYGPGGMGDYSSANSVPWYSDRTTIDRVEIEEGVTSIGGYAFYGCSSLTSIEIPDSVTSIGYSAFRGCSSLTSIDIPDTLYYISGSTFYNCSSLMSIEIPDSVTSIGSYAFSYCTSLTNVTIGDGVSSIGSEAFYGCSSLTSIEIPEGVTAIPSYCFQDCSSLTSIEIPDSVTSIGKDVFDGCSSLTSIEIPEGVTAIPSYCFQDCSSLTSIEIPDSVTSIGNYAFRDCSALETIYLDASQMTSVGSGAFSGCSNLREIIVGSSVDVLTPDLFKNAGSGKKISFEGPNYFTLSDDITESDAKTYLGEDLSFLKAGSNYFVDENGAIYLVENGTAYYLYSPMSNYIAPETIPTEAFDGTTYPVYSAKLPGVVKRNGDMIWMVYGDQLVILGDCEIPNYSKTGAPWYSYRGDIEEIVLADTITGIGNFAFNGFSQVTEIEIPRDAAAVSTSAFRNCTSLRNFTVDPENTTFSEENGILYNADQTVLVLCPPAKRSAREIPATVTTIGNYAFAYNDSLTGVTLPDALETIEVNAFYDCDGLTSITIPGETVTVGENAFYDCDGLTTVRVTAADAEIGKNAFYDCDAVTAVTVTSQTSAIGEGAFRSCDVLQKLDVRSEAVTLGEYAFYDCTDLEQISLAVLPDVIPAYAFGNCSAMTTFDVPAGYVVIGEDAFRGTNPTPWNQAKSGLHYVDEQGALYWICDGLAYYVGCPETVTDYRMLSQTPQIGDYGPYPVDSDVSSFLDYGTTGDLYWYIVDDSVCQTLVIAGEDEMPDYTSGTAPWNAYIGVLDDIMVEEGVATIGNYAFAGCKNVTSVNLPESVTKIGAHAIRNCEKLTSIEIPNSVESIGGSAFAHCSNLEKVMLPNQLTAIPEYAFYRCEKLSEIEIPESVTSIGGDAFSGCTGLTEIVIPDSVTSMGVRVFNGCTKLEQVTLSANLKSIPEGTFQYCTSLKSIEIPDGVTSIGKNAFQNCAELAQIVLPEGYVTVDATAFSGTPLNYLSGTIYTDANGVQYKIIDRKAYVVFQPEGVTDDMIPDYIDETGNNYPVVKGYTIQASGQCGDDLYWEILKSADSETLRIYGTGDMYNYNNNYGSSNTPWYGYRDVIDALVIEEGATAVGNYAFYNCSSLTGVEIPDSVTSIGRSAFSSCSSLTNIDIPDSVTSIGDLAFSDCSSLASIDIPDSVTSIGGSAFRYCRSLTEITISDSVTSIGNYTFYNCSSLTSVTIPDSVTSIGYYSVFENCRSLTEITIPDSVTSIGKYVFAGCTSLNTIHLASSNLTNVDGTAFQKSNKVDLVVVDPSVDILYPALFNAIKTYSGWPTIQFTGPNHFTVDSSFTADALSNLGPVASKMVPGGSYYVDAQGAIYQISDGAATLLHVPAGITELTIPATIPAADEGEETVPVIGVATGVLEAATDLTALVFESPETITSLADGCMAHCPTLLSVNGKTTVREAKAIFTNENLTMGEGILENTGLTSELEEWLSQRQTSEDKIKVVTDGVTVTVTTTSTETNTATEGNMAFYTGQGASSTVYFDRQSDSLQQTAYVYFCFSNPNETFNLGLGKKEFETTAPEGADPYKYIVNVSKLPYTNIYCMELEPLKKGHTVAIPVPYKYANGTEGGELLIWVEVQENGEKKAVSDVTQKLTWQTEPFDFKLTKDVYGAPKFSGDGTEGSSFAIYDLSYKVELRPIGNSRNATNGLGYDAMTRAEFVDVLTFPKSDNGQKLSWAEGVTDAVANGDWVSQEYKENNKQVGWEVAVPVDGQLKTLLAVRDTAATDLNVSLTENGDIALGWTKANGNINTPNPIFTQYVDVGDGMIVGESITDLNEDKEFQLHNDVSADQYFRFSDIQNDKAQSSKKVATNAAVMEAKKTADRGDTAYFGESYPYTITLKNTGTQHLHALNKIEDDLHKALYITPADMFEMLTEGRDGEYLTITISKATIYNQLPEGLSVTGTDGKEYTPDIQNTSIETWYHGMENKEAAGCIAAEGAKLVLKQSEGGVSVSLNGGEARLASSEDELRQVLFDLGYFVTPVAQYNVTWEFPEGSPMWSSEERDYHILSTVKDAFMAISWDYTWTPIWKVSEPAESTDLTANTAKISYILSEGMEPVSSQEVKSEDATLKRDFWVNTEYWTDSHDASSELIEGGGLVNLCVSVDHDGTASYDMVPFVSQMTGAQMLVVRVSDNPHLAAESYGLTVRTIGGIDYFLLDRDGEYPNVKIGGYLADCVKVDVNDSNPNDITTQMRWYLTNITGEKDMHINCKVLMVTNGEVTSSSVFAVDNEVWLNDHQTHRLWASMGSKWSFASFDKQIVTNHVEGTSVHDVADPDDETVLHDGDSVTYRLKITGMLSSASVQAGRTVVVPGTVIYDQLPKNIVPWTISDIEYVYNDAQVDIEGMELDSWYLTYNDPETGEMEEDQQYLVWNDLFRIIYHETSTVYIYITLDYPEGADWSEYCNSYGSDMLSNTMYFSKDTESVRHSLDMSASAKLVKGVSSTGVWKGDKYYPSTDSNSRFNYASEDNLDRIVTYYVALYNDGHTRLYLDDIQDKLPVGFTYQSNSVAVASDIAGIGDDLGQEVTYKKAVISAVKESTGNIRFTAGNGAAKADGTYEGDLNYDSIYDRYYLLPREALVFSYRCCVKPEAEAGIHSTNTAAMAYFDYNLCGVNVGQSTVKATGAELIFNNDGDCSVIADSTAGTYDFSSDLGEGTQWLMSQVRVEKGNIVPGIEKQVSGVYADPNGEAGISRTQATYYDFVTWEVITSNIGTTPMRDYVLTDVMQQTYDFKDEVHYTIHYGSNYVDNEKLTMSGSLFTMEELIKDENLNRESGQYTMTRTSDNFGAFDVTYTPHGELSPAVLAIHFKSAKAAIPEGGESVLSVTTHNGVTYRTSTYTNTCYVTPSQTWDENQVTTGVQEAYNGKPSVRSSADIAVDSAYLTASLKEVTEKSDPSNRADSDDEVNSIVLSSGGSPFTYTLKIQNTGEEKDVMDKLVIIDSLPKIGDHSVLKDSDKRDSEFVVWLAEEPNFTVTIGDQKLDTGPDTLQFSTKTSFSKDDWTGSGTGWDADPAKARSFRIVLTGAVNEDGTASGTVVPANTLVTVSFDAMIASEDLANGKALPGQTAWNSFGYNYSLGGSDVELASAPGKVGVKLPSIPQMIKKLETPDGRAWIAEKTQEFSYLIYALEEGLDLPELDGLTEDQIGEELQKAGAAFTRVTLTVPEGATESEVLMLKDLHHWSVADGVWTEGDGEWNWTQGGRYVFMELPLKVAEGEIEEYTFGTINGNHRNHFVYVHDRAQTTTIVGMNLRRVWNISLLKVSDGKQATPLSGAWFGLYGETAPAEAPVLPDALRATMTQKEFEKLLTLDYTEGEQTVTWYLQSVNASGSDGILLWQDLADEQYLVREIQAPEGYHYDGTVHVVQRPGDVIFNTVSMSVVNRSGYEMPKSGGIGTNAVTTMGALLIAASGAMLLLLKRRRKGTKA